MKTFKWVPRAHEIEVEEYLKSLKPLLAIQLTGKDGTELGEMVPLAPIDLRRLDAVAIKKE
jgi:hypothetical protein